MIENFLAGLKFLSVLLLIYYQGLFFGLIAALSLRWLIIYLISIIYKVERIQLLDLACLYDNRKNNCNMIGIFMTENLSFEEGRSHFMKKTEFLSKYNLKLRYIWGIPFWDKISEQEKLNQFKLCQQQLNSMEDLEEFLGQIINTKIPRNGPQFEVLYIPNYNGDQSVMVVKAQHCMYDGLGGQFVLCALNDVFDPETLPQIREASILKKLLMNISVIYYLPLTAIKCFFQKTYLNPLQPSQKLTGIKKISIADEIPFEIIRNSSKKFQVTVNDFMMTVLSISVKKYFDRKNFVSKDKIFNISLPISVRFKIPKSIEDFELINQFSPAKVSLPIVNDFESGVKQIGKIMNKMKTSFEYFANIYSGKILLQIGFETIIRLVVKMLTLKDSMNFSNVAGPRKQIYFKGKELKNVIGMFNATGYCGLNLIFYSYMGIVRIVLVSDTGRLENPKEFTKIIEETIYQICETTKNN